MDTSSRYNPKESEGSLYASWEKEGLFKARASAKKKPFCIVIPPPNVTGILHMGHALNNTFQDILIRTRRMQGFEALWVPGTDHAGIATQNVVEKSLAKEGITRKDLGREKFVEKVKQWKEEYGSTIIRQLKKLGASCDWSRTRFTMDDEYSAAVTEVFIRLWNKKLIYQDDKVINWCPRCQTALSDEAAPVQARERKLYYKRNPLRQKPVPDKTKGRVQQKKNEALPLYIVVATTRPETMLGDTAVAVNPKDKRYKKLVGSRVILPVTQREIPIIADTSIDMKFGTGAVKVTPAHDPNDYVLGKKHGLAFITMMHPDATLNENAAGYQGMDRFAAREALVNDLSSQGLIEKIEPHDLSVGHCYRCHTVIEPYLSRQWFVKMKPLATSAIKAVKTGKIKFYPSRWKKVYLNWMENIQDWCISRQIWWGHRIPLWYCLDCKKEAVASAVKPDRCRKCGSQRLKQDEDVLDTWFSSWLWPFATFYWPFKSPDRQKEYQAYKEDLKFFYPTSVLVTAPEIIFFWVARMIMAGFEFMGGVPFDKVFIHGTVRDATGQKMSKSKGNVIDPLEIIDEFGADALRFSLIMITAHGQDVFLSQERFLLGRNFANKVWNAARYIIGTLEKKDYDLNAQVYARQALTIYDYWIFTRLHRATKNISKAIDGFKFNEAARCAYEFFWHDFCDWYIEIAKMQKDLPHTPYVLLEVLSQSLRLLHPFMPFITESLWTKLPIKDKSRWITDSSWPAVHKDLVCEEKSARCETIRAFITTVRTIVTEHKITPDKKITLHAYVTKKIAPSIDEAREVIVRLSGAAGLTLYRDGAEFAQKTASLIKQPKEDFEVALDFAFSKEEERKRISKEKEKVASRLEGIERNLANQEFLKKAPAQVIEKQKSTAKTLREELEKIESYTKTLA